MSELAIENTGFSKIVDTVYDSKVLKGLVSSGVLPSTFRVIKGYVTFDNDAKDSNLPILDVNTNEQVKLSEGNAILYAAVYGLASGSGSATYNVNYASTAGGVAPGTNIFKTSAAAPVGGLALATVQAGLTNITVSNVSIAANPTYTAQNLNNGTVIPISSDQFLQVAVGAAAAVDGTLNVVLVVV